MYNLGLIDFFYQKYQKSKMFRNLFKQKHPHKVVLHGINDFKQLLFYYEFRKMTPSYCILIIIFAQKYKIRFNFFQAQANLTLYFGV